jgi:hypothetical protein
MNLLPQRISSIESSCVQNTIDLMAQDLQQNDLEHFILENAK